MLENNPYLTQPNADESRCPHCGGLDNHDKRCPEMHRCPECFGLVEGGEDHDGQCTRAAEARAERHDELTAELIGIARAAAGVLR